MMTEGVDFESIQVGNSQLRLPSSICTDKTIFQSIFSLDTWNTLFTSDQKERILKMLPTEVLSSPGLAVATIEDLLSGTLTRFDSNPLDSFFNELNVGGYDPEVAQLKSKIKRQLKRDLLRKKRNYHTKLMQDVIISSETCLHKLRDKTFSKLDSSITMKSKISKAARLNHQEAPKLTPKKKSASSKPSPLRQKVAKRLHNEILAMNQAFPSSNISSEDGVSAPKKRLQEKKPSKSKKSTSKLAVTNEGTGISLKQISTSPVHTSCNTNSPTVLLSQLNSNTNRLSSAMAKLNDSPQPSIQMAKFPSVIPPSLLGVINVTQGPSGLPNPKPYVSLSHQDIIVPSKDISHQNRLNPPALTPQVIQKHALKSSPILASQLQAPIASANRPNAVEISSIPVAGIGQSVNHIRRADNLFPTTLIKIEEESSSEDEFEAIEPTIGFSTMLLPIMNKSMSHQPKPSKVIGHNTNTRAQSITSTMNNKIMPTKKVVIPLNSTLPKNLASQSQSIPTTTTPPPPSNTLLPKPYVHPPLIPNVNVKVTNSKAIITTTSNLSQNKFQNLNMNSLKMISGTPLSFLPNAHSSPGTTAAATSTKLTSNLYAANNNPSAKLLPITLSSLVQQPSLISASVNNNTQTLRTSAFHGSVASSSEVMVNGASQFSPRSVNTAVLNSSGNEMSTSVNSLGVKSCGGGGGYGGTVDSSRSNSNSMGIGMTSSLSPIPLTLSHLSLSLNLGLDVTGDKLEDKIDDLPVLDGNAFDSIPNLSDDLDVYDLDLVDGLCDFEVMLSEEKQYSSFFALIREVLCSTQNHRMTLACLEKTVRKWAGSPSSELNLWFRRIHGWNDSLITALNFLAGNYQEIHPEDFVPYIEYKYKTKYYQWIGAGRDNDNNLQTLCNMWLENLDRLPPMKKQDPENEEHEEEEDENEDSDEHMEEVKKKYLRPKTPPPPRFATDWTVRPSTNEEKDEYQVQEKVRFDNPHKAFTYRMHMYESVVGPVKGVYSNQTGVTNKARGHSLLVDDRPPYVTILALVRDSVARLPNGEGTRSEICEMLRDSAFLAPEASNVTLNSVVSGALDRLHYERDPCVRYDSHKKNWIYLHRDRSQEQFERLHHNRSYTKSTKSRNSNGRKSRKKTLSQSSGPNPSTNTTDSMSAIQSSSSSVSSTPSTTPTHSISSAALATAVNSPPSATITSQVVAAPQPAPPVTANTIPSVSSAKSTAVNKVFVSATSGSSPTIQFAIPVSSGQILLNKNWVSSNPDPGGAPHAAPSYASLPNVGSQSMAPTTLPNQTAQFQSTTSPITSPLGKTLSIKLENPVNLASVSTSSTSTNPSLQQQSFILNNIFRVPNLKLPENVRFMRIQQSPNVGVPGNPLRLPQQRIVLRQAFPGQVPGQGVIVGQTPTGQTVIISAIGSHQTSCGISTTQTQSSNTTQTAETKSLPMFTPTTLPTSSILTMLNSTTTGNSSYASNTNSTTPFGSSASALVLNQGKIIPSTPAASSIPSASVVRLTSGSLVQANRTNPLSSLVTSTFASTVANSLDTTSGVGGHNSQSMQQKWSQLQHFGMAPTTQFHHMAKSQPTPMAGAVAATTTDMRMGNAQLPPCPVVIRSNQMEYLIPRHHISLGRGGVHGIKMIPVSTTGNQIFARLVSPGQATVGTTGISQTSTQTPTNVSTSVQQQLPML